MAMSASAFALLGTFLNWIAAFIMFFIYSEDHENLTNAEKDWADELKKRELVAVKTPHGNRIMQKRHLKYMKARISSWNWVLPIILTLIACGFGVAANFHPKVSIHIIAHCSKIRKKCNFKSAKKALFESSKMAKNQFLHQKKV